MPKKPAIKPAEKTPPVKERLPPFKLPELNPDLPYSGKDVERAKLRELMNTIWVAPSASEEERIALLVKAVDMFNDFKVEDGIEGMLAVQMIGTHHAIVECFRRAIIPEQPLSAEKIYASKRKGIWMGGPVPLGYDVIDRKLVANEAEAEQVRHIMQLYLKVGSVPELVEVLAKNGSLTKVQQRKDGGTRGGVYFKRGNLYHLLSNRIYRGMTVHKGEAFEGEHEAIVAEELWDQVQAKLAKQGQGGSSRKVGARTGVLAGLIYNAEGTAMVLTHTQKGNRRFHYYANRYENIGDSMASRVSARDIEDIIVGQLSQTLKSSSQVQSVLLDGTYKAGQLHNLISRCRQLADELSTAKYMRKQAIIRSVINRVELHENRVVIKIDNRSLLNVIGAEGAIQPSISDLIIEREAIRLRRGKALRLIIPAASAGDGMSLRDDKLVALIAESRAIIAQITTNPDKSVPTLAAEQGRCRVRMMKVAKLVGLDPYIVTAIVEGRQPLKLTPGKLLATDLPLAWADQRQFLGFG